jgi:hypothetical protein
LYPYHIVFTSSCIHIRPEDWGRIVFVYVQNIFFHIVFLASTVFWLIRNSNFNSCTQHLFFGIGHGTHNDPTWSSFQWVLRGHDNRVTSVAFSPTAGTSSRAPMTIQFSSGMQKSGSRSESPATMTGWGDRRSVVFSSHLSRWLFLDHQIRVRNFGRLASGRENSRTAISQWNPIYTNEKSKSCLLARIWEWVLRNSQVNFWWLHSVYILHFNPPSEFLYMTVGKLNLNVLRSFLSAWTLTTISNINYITARTHCPTENIFLQWLRRLDRGGFTFTSNVYNRYSGRHCSKQNT